jgi:uncharacterized protein (DUF58 family)
MSRAWFLGLLLFVILISGFSTLRGSEIALGIPVLLYWLYAIWRAPDALDLKISRQLSAERVPPGTTVEVKVTLFNAGGALDELMLEDALPAGLEVVEGSNRHLLSLGRQRRCAFTYTVRGPRGAYAFGTLRARGGDALGLLPRAASLYRIRRASRLSPFALVEQGCMRAASRRASAVLAQSSLGCGHTSWVILRGGSTGG